MKISNPVAEREARRLARDYEQHVLGVMTTALVTEKTRPHFLRDAHIYFEEAGVGAWFGQTKYEHVELTCDSNHLPDDITREALGEFSTIKTIDLGRQFTLDAIVEAQRSRRIELAVRARKLAGGRLRRLKSRRRRRSEWAEHLVDALGSLDGLPATGIVFKDVFRSLLHAAGVAWTGDGYALADSGEAEALGSFTAGDLGEEYQPEEIMRRSAGHADELRDRWETILVWTHEATFDESGDATGDFELGPRKRFREACIAAKAKHEQYAEERESNRRRVEEQERGESRRRLAESRARQQTEADERRARRITKMRGSAGPVVPDLNLKADEGFELEL